MELRNAGEAEKNIEFRCIYVETVGISSGVKINA
jgi:hypothetical protein